MRELSVNEIANVSGGAISHANMTFFIDKSLGYGATGVLANILLNGATFAIGWEGFVIGACVGAGLAGVTILAHEIGIY